MGALQKPGRCIGYKARSRSLHTVDMSSHSESQFVNCPGIGGGYYAAKTRPLCARRHRDEALKTQVLRVHRENFGVYGMEKILRQLAREQIGVGRDRVHRLMRELKLRGVVRGKRVWTTIRESVAARPADLVERQFTATAPNRLWVADLTYVSTWFGFAYAALIIDAFSRAIVGWRVSTSLRSDLALDALEMAIWARHPKTGDRLIHHSDRGVQYLAIRYSERLAEAGAVTSVGSRGDSYDNALAETVIGHWVTSCGATRRTAVFMARPIRRRRPPTTKPRRRSAVD